VEVGFGGGVAGVVVVVVVVVAVVVVVVVVVGVGVGVGVVAVVVAAVRGWPVAAGTGHVGHSVAVTTPAVVTTPSTPDERQYAH